MWLSVFHSAGKQVCKIPRIAQKMLLIVCFPLPVACYTSFTSEGIEYFPLPQINILLRKKKSAIYEPSSSFKLNKKFGFQKVIMSEVWVTNKMAVPIGSKLSVETHFLKRGIWSFDIKWQENNVCHCRKSEMEYYLLR